MTARRRFGAASAIVVWLCGAEAGASGLSVPVIGTTESSPVHGDAASVHWNPALMMEAREAALVAGNLVLLSAGYARERLSTYQHRDGLAFSKPGGDDIDPTRSGSERRVSSNAAIPSASAFAIAPVGRRVSAGIGFFPSFGAVLGFDEGGPQRYAAQGIRLMAVELAPAVAMRASPHLSIGGGVGLVGGMLQMSKVVDLAGTDMLHDTFADPPIGQANDFGPTAPSTVRELDALSRNIDIGPAFGISYAARMGALFTPWPFLGFGLSYIHRGDMRFRGAFALDLNDPLFTHDLAAQGLRYPAEVNGRAEVAIALPSSLHGGIRVQPTARLALSATFAWFRYAAVKTFDTELISNELVQPELGLGNQTQVSIPRDWKDTWQADLRATLGMGSGLRGGMVVGYHTPAAPDHTLDVASIDMRKVTAGGFVAFDLGPLGWFDSSSLELVADLNVQWGLRRRSQTSDYDLANGSYDIKIAQAGLAARICL